MPLGGVQPEPFCQKSSCLLEQLEHIDLWLGSTAGLGSTTGLGWLMEY